MILRLLEILSIKRVIIIKNMLVDNDRMGGFKILLTSRLHTGIISLNMTKL